MEDFPTLVARIHDKGELRPPLTQNLQMMRSKPCEEDINVNILPRSGIIMGDDKGKNEKIVLRFAKPRKKMPSLIWSALRKPSWKLRRASLMPPL